MLPDTGPYAARRETVLQVPEKGEQTARDKTNM
jgi:hypothetical protein